jgi:hypothetical protein
MYLDIISDNIIISSYDHGHVKLPYSVFINDIHCVERIIIPFSYNYYASVRYNYLTVKSTHK